MVQGFNQLLARLLVLIKLKVTVDYIAFDQHHILVARLVVQGVIGCML